MPAALATTAEAAGSGTGGPGSPEHQAARLLVRQDETALPSLSRGVLSRLHTERGCHLC